MRIEHENKDNTYQQLQQQGVAAGGAGGNVSAQQTCKQCLTITTSRLAPSPCKECLLVFSHFTFRTWTLAHRNDLTDTCRCR